jgi:chromosome segregation ATPase
MEKTYEVLIEENSELRKALASSKELLERFRSDNDSLRRMHEDYKNHYDRLKKECTEYQQRCVEAVSARKDIEGHFEAQMRRLKAAFDQKKKEFDELQTKMIPPLDNDMMRLKLINEIEAPHRAALEQKQEEIYRLTEGNYELTRKLELLQVEYQNYRQEEERELRDLRERAQQESVSYSREVQMLQERLEDPSDREVIRALRKEKEELKLRVSEQFVEIDELCRVKETLKADLNDQQAAFNRDIDEERNKRRTVAIEKDRCSVLLKDASEQVQKLKLQVELKTQELSNLKQERETLSTNISISKEQLDQARSMTTQLQDRLLKRDTDFEVKLRQGVESEHNKLEAERKERESLQRAIQDIEMKRRELELTANNREKQLRTEAEQIKQELNLAKEDTKLLESKLSHVVKESEMTRVQLQSRSQEYEKLNYEREAWSDKWRRQQELLQEAQLEKERLKKMLETLQREAGQRPAAEESRRLADKLAASENKSALLIGKVREYKAKVRISNEKLAELYKKFMLREGRGKEAFMSREAAEVLGLEGLRREEEVKLELARVQQAMS